MAGKTLISRDGLLAAVVVHDALARDEAGYVILARTIAHEFGHVLYGAVRTAAVGPVSDTAVPWEIAQIIPCLAAEEFRVDVLAAAVTSQVLKATDNTGSPIPLPLDVDYGGVLQGALDEVLPGLPSAVERYRLSGTQEELGLMWSTIARVSEEILTLIAHVEGHRDHGPSAIAHLEHPALDLLRPLVVPFFEHVARPPIIPPVANFADDRARLKEIGRVWMDIWRRIGVHPRRGGPNFAIWVGGVDEPPPAVAGAWEWKTLD